MALPTRKIGRRKVHRAQLAPMENASGEPRLWCVACCDSSPAPPAGQPFEEWRCERGHGYWYWSEGERVEALREQDQRLARLRTAKARA